MDDAPITNYCHIKWKHFGYIKWKRVKIPNAMFLVEIKGNFRKRKKYRKKKDQEKHKNYLLV